MGILGSIIEGIIEGNREYENKKNQKYDSKDYSEDELGIFNKSEKKQIKKGYYEAWELEEETDKPEESEYYNDDGTYKK